MPAPAQTYQVKDQSSLHRYRTEIPNIIEDMDLSVHAFRLYVRFKRVAGDSGKCYYSTRELAEHCHMSVGAVSNAKQELLDKDLIRIERGDGTRDRDIITIIDVWPANFAHFAREAEQSDCSPHEHNVHHMNSAFTTCTRRSPHEHYINEKEEPIKKEPVRKEPGGGRKAPPLQDDVDFMPDAGASNGISAHTPKQAIYAAICEALGWDRKVISATDQDNVAEAVTKLYAADYRAEDIRRFMTEIWFRGWQWEKDGQRPTLKQLRQEIGKLRASTPEPVPRPTKMTLSEEEKGAIRARARLAQKSLQTAEKFKGNIDPAWQQDIDKAKNLGVL